MEKIEAAITPKTKAILPVHLFGRPTQMAKLMKVADEHQLKVVEDCAQSFGAMYDGKQTGSIGHCGTYSFFPTKNLGGIGDGGMIVTDDDEVAKKARMLRVHGADKKYHNEIFGYNSRLDTIQATVLKVKLKHIDEFNAKRRQVAQRYNEGLNNTDHIILPEIVDGHVFHQYTVWVKDGSRDNLKNYLEKQGIGTKIYFPVPQNELPVYRGEKVLKISKDSAKSVLSLPMWPHLTAEVQDHVIGAIKRYFR